MFEVSEKKCLTCGETKSREHFWKHKYYPDGLTLHCKECLKLRSCGISLKTIKHHNTNGPIEKNEKEDEPVISKNQINDGIGGIESEIQIDSVIREMAELRSMIEEEKIESEKKVSLIKNCSYEYIGPLFLHIRNLYSMLISFLKKSGINEYRKCCRFGNVIYSDNHLKVELNIELAKQRIDKP